MKMKYLRCNQILMSNYPYSKYSLDFTLNSLKRIGANNIEFYAVFPHFYLDDVCEHDAVILHKKLKSYGLSVKCFTPEQCVYPVNIAAKDAIARKRSVDLFHKSINCGAELGAESIVLLAGYGTLDEKEEEAWKRSEESLYALANQAKECGIRLLLETSPREYTVTHNSKDILRMISDVGINSLSGMIDTATLGYSGESMKQAIDDLEGHLGHIHVADGTPNGHLAIGEGGLPLKKMLYELDEACYGGYLSLEILNDRYNRRPEQAMQISYDRLKNILENN